ncbi:MAG TPA: Hpt domain-containing protein [Terriglobales bacterium]|nr:Hpt domain-containing protein [Terriglobales bacterium]
MHNAKVLGGAPGEQATDGAPTVALDAGVLRSLSAPGNADLTVRLLSLFLSDTPGRVAELLRAADLEHRDTVCRIAHYLHGSAACVGANEMAGRCGELEKQSGCASHGDLRLLATAIANAFSHAEAEARDWLAQARTEP